MYIYLSSESDQEPTYCFPIILTATEETAHGKLKPGMLCPIWFRLDIVLVNMFVAYSILKVRSSSDSQCKIL